MIFKALYVIKILARTGRRMNEGVPRGPRGTKRNYACFAHRKPQKNRLKLGFCPNAGEGRELNMNIQYMMNLNEYIEV